MTATGNRGVIRLEHFALMKDGAILANSGHFDVEINVAGLRALAVGPARARAHVDEYRLPSGRRLYLLAEGRLVGQARRRGQPGGSDGLSFANQALGMHLDGRPLTPGLTRCRRRSTPAWP